MVLQESMYHRKLCGVYTLDAIHDVQFLHSPTVYYLLTYVHFNNCFQANLV